MLKKVPLHYLYLAAGITFLATCWFSIGFKHGDEHFQIFEFAGHLLGWNSDSDMAWEFHKRMRPTLQPCITALGISGLNAIGLEDPFINAFIFRIFGSLSLFFAIYFFLKKEGLEKNHTTVFFLFFFCLTPYLSARYSSEGLSASMLLMLVAQLRNVKKNIDYFYAGIFAGLAFAFRFQLAFALVGTAIWYLLAKTFNWKEVALYFSGFLILFIFSVLCDRYFYGEWVLAPYEYFYQNIVLNKASDYGVSPWYYYLIKPIMLGLWLPGLLVMGAAVWYAIKKPKDVITLCMLVFLIGHMLVSHKEVRFLYPIGVLLPFLVWDRLESLRNFRYKKILVGLLIVSNFILIIPNIFLPASQEISILKFLEKNYPEKSFVLYFDGQNNPYLDFGLPNHFYGRKQPTFVDQSEIEKKGIQLPAVWISFRCNEEGKQVGNYKLKRIYQTYPEWVTDHMNINGWVNKTSIITVYQLVP
jgi:phosphatidylinositol glycan class B